MDLKFDIETIPAGDPEDVVVKVPANYKKQETIDKYILEHRDEEFRKGALHGISGQIISIAWQVDSESIECLTRTDVMSVTGEADMLQDFFNQLCGGRSLKDTARIKWIGHNSIDFDLRYLKQRCWVQDVMPPVIIPADAKHGHWAFDVMKEWAGWKGYVKQDELYKALGGQPYADDDIDGSMVYDLWLAGEYDKIRDYNIRDVEKLSYNYERLK